MKIKEIGIKNYESKYLELFKNNLERLIFIREDYLRMIEKEKDKFYLMDNINNDIESIKTEKSLFESQIKLLKKNNEGIIKRAFNIIRRCVNLF